MGRVDEIPGDRYQFVAELATSTHGAVYHATDTVLDRPVAIKCVRLDESATGHPPEELRERFLREAKICARLQHQNIVAIHDVVTVPGRGYIIMEFIEGCSLESLLETGRLPLSTAIRVISQLASALDYAHARDVVHRDVKPSNILVSPSHHAWVTDFGIAKSELSTSLTVAGGLTGTPDYMSPEHAKGEDVDARSDLFSLGCVLFESVVGEKPFRSPSLTGVLLSIINDEPVFPLNWGSLGLPRELRPILHRALEKDRDKRYASGAEMVEALTALPEDAVERADELARQAAAEAREAEPEDAPPEDASETEDVRDTAAEGETAPSDAVAEPDAVAETSPEPVEEPEDSIEPGAEAPPASDEEPAATAAPEPSAPDDEPGESEESEESEQHDEPEELDEEEIETAEMPAQADAPGPVSTPSESVEPEAAATAEEREIESEADSVPEDVRTEAAEETAEPLEETADAEPPAEDALDVDAARDPAAIEPMDPDKLQELKEERQPLRVSPTLYNDPEAVEISPEEGFLLSRIDGESSARDILALSPMPEAETGTVLMNLLGKGLISMGSSARSVAEPSRPSNAPDEAAGDAGADEAEPAEERANATPVPPEPEGPDPELVREVDRLSELADNRDYAAFLGVEVTATASERKSAFLKFVARYHPDKHRDTDDAFRARLSSLCASASDAAASLEKQAKSLEESMRAAQERNAQREAEASARTNLDSSPNVHAGARPAQSSPPAAHDSSAAFFDKKRFARELYSRSLSAYDEGDYWEAVQLGRRALELDDSEAEYHAALGRALLQNKKWRREAADRFVRASELQPARVEYIGLLGAIYRSEGLATRANALLERARVLEPDYEFPELP